MVAGTSHLEMQIAHQREVARGERFAFGDNWRRFLELLDETRIARAEASLAGMIGVSSLAGRTFLDVGCGSGLFSLAARRLGARVHSFDYDPASAACAMELRRRYFPADADWTIEQGSILDDAFMNGLGTFDVVYSWGVLHHTSRMWEGIEAACRGVAPGGTLFIAIYNDLGTRSRRWAAIKKLYTRLPRPLRPVLTALASAPEEIKTLARAILPLRPGEYVRRWTAVGDRGMSHWRDAVDWVGGHPYEVATPEAIFDFVRARGFTLTRLKCGGVGLGCNEFVFERTGA